MKIKVNIDTVEWWPVYILNSNTVSAFYEVDEELFEKYKKVMKEFNKMQDQLESITIED